MATRLLLAVAAEANVDRQLARARQLARGAEKHEELPLVVDRAAAIEILAADLGLERIGVPQLERVGRLHVEVAVAEHRRSRLGIHGRPDLTDCERLSVPVDDLALATCRADEVADPFAGSHTSAAWAGSAEIEGMRRNSASSSNQGSDTRASLAE